MVPAPGLTAPQVAILTGPTATGKSGLAIELAERHGGIELINADSMLVYRGLDIGTAKPTPEERARVRHHLIDVREPSEAYTAGDFVRESRAAVLEIHGRGRRALIVGGTGFYLKALLFGLWEGAGTDPVLRARLEKEDPAALYRRLFARDETSALRIGANDHYRLIRALELIELSGKSPTELQAERPAQPDEQFALWVTDREDAEIQARINERTAEMLASGFLDEVRALRAAWPGSRALSAVGYREAGAYLEGKPPRGRKLEAGIPGLAREIELATRQLVKRQRTWFRGQKHARWFTLERDRAALEQEFARHYG